MTPGQRRVLTLLACAGEAGLRLRGINLRVAEDFLFFCDGGRYVFAGIGFGTRLGRWFRITEEGRALLAREGVRP